LRTQSHAHSDWSQTQPIKIIDSFLSTLKSVKVNYVHSMKCVKSKHQRCEFRVYFNHHHNILGDALIDFQKESSADEQNGQSESMCLIAAWCNFLLDMKLGLRPTLSKQTPHVNGTFLDCSGNTGLNFFPEKLSIIIEFTISKAYFCTGPENLGRYLSTLPTTTSTCIQQHIPD
jgi:hypothetical protein